MDKLQLAMQQEFGNRWFDEGWAKDALDDYFFESPSTYNSFEWVVNNLPLIRAYLLEDENCDITEMCKDLDGHDLDITQSPLGKFLTGNDDVKFVEDDDTEHAFFYLIRNVYYSMCLYEYSLTESE